MKRLNEQWKYLIRSQRMELIKNSFFFCVYFTLQVLLSILEYTSQTVTIVLIPFECFCDGSDK